MARGNYLSLEEARRLSRLDQFCKEHPSEGDMNLWDRLFGAMIRGGPPDSIVKARASKTSSRVRDANYSGTRTRRDTSEDA